MLYHIAFWATKGTTVGGMICNLRVVKLDGQPLRPAEQRALIAETAEKRDTLKRQIAELAAERDAYIDARLETEGSAKDSLDLKIYEAVRAQAAPLGIDYEDGPRF